MKRAEDIKNALQSRVGEIRENTTVIDNVYLLNIKNITDGVLIIYSDWSGNGIVNCDITISTII